MRSATRLDKFAFARYVLVVPAAKVVWVLYHSVVIFGGFMSAVPVVHGPENIEDLVRSSSVLFSRFLIHLVGSDFIRLHGRCGNVHPACSIVCRSGRSIALINTT